MAEEKRYITYSIILLTGGRWFVESDKGTSGYSFRSLGEAEQFAIKLAQNNRPSKVALLDKAGDSVTEMVFDEAPAGGGAGN